MRPTRLLALSVALPVLLLAAPAYASGSSTLDSAVQLAFGLLAPLAGTVGVLGARWLQGKTRLDLSREVQAGVDFALGLAEERARAHLRRSGAKLPGDEKLRLAVEQIAQLARQNRWPQWVAQRGAELVEARLGSLRMRGRD